MQALRTGGVRELWWRGLAVTAFRRLIVVARDRDAQPRAIAADGIDVAPIDDPGPYRVLRPDTPAAEVRRRLAAGHACVGAWSGDRLVAARWLSRGDAEMPYLDLAFALPSHIAYWYDSYTDPAFRGRRAHHAIDAAATEWMRDHRLTVQLSTVLPENRGGVALVARTGSRRIGWVGCLRGPRGVRVPVRRVAEGFVGTARPMPASAMAPPRPGGG